MNMVPMSPLIFGTSPESEVSVTGSATGSWVSEFVILFNFGVEFSVGVTFSRNGIELKRKNSKPSSKDRGQGWTSSAGAGAGLGRAWQGGLGQGGGD